MHPMALRGYRGKLVFTPDSPLAGDPCMCRRFNINGQWETVLAPWACDEPGCAYDLDRWFNANVADVVNTTISKKGDTDYDAFRPYLEVYKLKRFEPSWADSNLLAVVNNERCEGPNLHVTAIMGLSRVRTYLLVDPLAVGKLVRELCPVLFPNREPARPRDRSKLMKVRNHISIEERIDLAKGPEA